MVVREIVIAGIPKSRTAFSYKASPTVTYSEVPSVKANEEISPSDPSLDGQRDLIMVQELPVGGGFNDVMYADLRKHSFAYWTEPEEPEPETNDDPEPAPGYFTVIANARARFGEEAALDAEGIDEWLYVITDKKEIRRWVPPPLPTEHSGGDPAPGGGFYETVANIRVWDGAHAERPAQGIEGWLYIEQDTRLVFIWDGAKYINISGVVDIQVEAAPSQSKTPLVIEYEEEETKSVAKLSIKNATSADVGVVKPDGSTITVSADGKITGTKLAAGTGISLNPSTGLGNVTVTNSGVTGVSAGNGISVSASAGSVRITNTKPMNGSTFNGFSYCPYYGYHTNGGGKNREAFIPQPQPFHPVTGEITFPRVFPGKTVKCLLDENITPANTSGWSVNIFLKDPEQQMTAGTYIT
ncbi:MAG: hypothetical protein LBB73_07545, partial [Dysgonamonadaceae bacterium]|nr:hypothetical protein [Dysgonamonadaceae bacterium]